MIVKSEKYRVKSTLQILVHRLTGAENSNTDVKDLRTAVKSKCVSIADFY
jgi:hypothetical protein